MNLPTFFGIADLIMITLLLTLAGIMIFSNIEKRSIKWKIAILIITAGMCFTLGNDVVIGLFQTHDTVTIRFNKEDGRILSYYTNTAPEFTKGLEYIDTSTQLPLEIRIDNYIKRLTTKDHFDTVGLYMLSGHSISIKDTSINSDVWSHEVAHHIWYSMLTEEERRNWTVHYDTEKQLYADAQQFKKETGFASNITGFFLTEYSLTDVKEDYADSFAFYVNPIHRTDGSWRKEQLDTQFTKLLNCSTTDSAFACFYSGRNKPIEITVPGIAVTPVIVESSPSPLLLNETANSNNDNTKNTESTTNNVSTNATKREFNVTVTFQ